MAGVSGWLPLEVEESLKLKWFALVKKKKTKRKSKKKKLDHAQINICIF